MRTSVNDIDCSNMTVKEVEKLLQKQVEDYVLTVVKSDGTNEQIKATDIGIEYIGFTELKEALSEQNEYLWPKALFSVNKIKVEVVFEYDKEKLDTVIDKLECMQTENQEKAVSAKVVYKEGQFVIQEEVAGTQIDAEKIKELAQECILSMNPRLYLWETGCYLQPAVTKDSKELIQAKDTANSYLGASIQYAFDDIKMSLEKDDFVSWISVNKKQEVTISSDKVKVFAKSIAKEYNTPNQPAVFTTQEGKTVTVPNAISGRTVDVTGEIKQIVKDIQSGKEVTREPLFSNKGTDSKDKVWKTTYVEVDIKKQHMWFVKDDKVVFECDVVTGKPDESHNTPTGVFTVLEKLRNKTLLGNIMPNGKREYETPVAYWVRVTWSGVGFHDATWQAAFGGERYKQGYGSHGCINMPLDAVAKFYDLVYVGCPIIIH